MLLIFFLCMSSESRLVSVVEVCRHGARSPTTFMPWDNDVIWPQGPGELIPEGMRQHYLLGAELRQRYIIDQALIVPEYYQPQIYVFSSDYNRTLMSAESQIQGLFPNGTGPLLRSLAMETAAKPPINVTEEAGLIQELGLSALPNLTQIIPIHTDSTIRQFALNPSSACSFYNDLADYKMTLPAVAEIYAKYNDVITAYMNVLGVNQTTAQNMARKISDSLISNVFIGNNLPAGISESVYERGQLLADELKSFQYFEPDLLARLAGTSLMSQVLVDLQNTIGKNTTVRFFLYSAHDTTVSFTLAFLQLNFTLLPPFASTLFFELNEYNNNYFVTLKYNDVYQLIPTCGAINCSIYDFERYVQLRIIPEIETVCGYSIEGVAWGNAELALKADFKLPGHNDNEDLKWYFWVATVSYSVLVFGLIIAVACCLPRRKEKGGKFADTSLTILKSN